MIRQPGHTEQSGSVTSTPATAELPHVRTIHHPSCPGDELCICPPSRTSRVCPDCGGWLLVVATRAGFHAPACVYWDDHCTACGGPLDDLDQCPTCAAIIPDPLQDPLTW